MSRIPTSLLAGPTSNRAFFAALYRILAAQGLRPVSFVMPVSLAANSGGPLFRCLDPPLVLQEKAKLRTPATGILVLYRR